MKINSDGRLVAQAVWLYPKVAGCLQSSHELSELSQWHCHDSSTTNIVLVTVIISNIIIHY